MSNETGATQSKDAAILSKAEQWLILHIFGTAKGQMIIAVLKEKGWIV